MKVLYTYICLYRCKIVVLQRTKKQTNGEKQGLPSPPCVRGRAQGEVSQPGDAFQQNVPGTAAGLGSVGRRAGWGGWGGLQPKPSPSLRARGEGDLSKWEKADMRVTLVASQGCLSNAASFTEASLSSSKLERAPHASESWEPLIWWLLPVSAFSESPLQSKSLPRYLRLPSRSLVPAPLPHCSPSGFLLG